MNGHSLIAQRGLTMWGWLVVLVVAGFLMKIGFSLMPVYITNYSVQSTIKALQNEPELGSKSILQVRMAIEKKFDVNQVRHIEAVCRNKTKPCLKIEKTIKAMTVDANYEARVHVMGNVDAVVKFDNNIIEIPIAIGR